jgi:hypothetical protein
MRLVDELNEMMKMDELSIRQVGSNMSELDHKGHTILHSYSTPVAAKLPDGSFIHTNKKWSATTSRHVSKWLAGNKSKPVDQSVLDKLLD